MWHAGGSSVAYSPHSVPLYRIWPSQGNMILFWGLCITGRHPIVLVLVLLCAIVPYSSFVSNTPVEDLYTGSVLFLTIWFILTLLLILRVALSDPGVIPRRDIAEKLYGQNLSLVDPYSSVSGAVFCHTCQIHRPLDASHCIDCDNCVMGFDHHCVVLNNCIARRNYPYFLGLLFSIFFYTVSFFFQVRFPGSHDVSVPAVMRFIASFSIFLAVLIFIFVFSLMCFHLYLIFCAKTTTKNIIRNRHSDELSIWDRLNGGDALFDLRTRIFIPNEV